tara:strand:+ start:627 stop:1091 length:465 start_codon:yes stop_codon:yes gene_type:complete
MTKTLPALALFQPDIPQNLGAIMRLCACMNVHLHIIEPCGFPFNEKKVRRSAMDYIDHLSWTRHASWDDFIEMTKQNNSRLILMTTKGAKPYIEFEFHENDILIAGSESNGAPDFVHETCKDNRLFVPMHGQTRSLNIGMACAMFLGEAQRQLL